MKLVLIVEIDDRVVEAAAGLLRREQAGEPLTIPERVQLAALVETRGPSEQAAIEAALLAVDPSNPGMEDTGRPLTSTTNPI
ncbi:MAG: hypothetical protein GX879_11790 [Bacteroidales bacterium]|nr:hypothetical protein [Bacteroidales bacterium]